MNQVNLIPFIQALPDEYLNVFKKMLDSHTQHQFYEKEFLAFLHIKANITAQHQHRLEKNFDEQQLFGEFR